MRPALVVRALMGLHAVLVSSLRRSIVDEHLDRVRIARDVRKEGEKVLRLLEKGFAGYAVKE